MFLAAIAVLLQVGDPLGVTVDEIRLTQDILHYSIRVSIPEEGSEIEGSTQVRYRTAESRGPLVLDFDEVFEIDSVISSAGTRVRHELVDGRLLIHDQDGSSDARAVTVFYHGSPTDGLFIQDNVHGLRTAFADNWPNRAHHWFPSEDHPSDKATVTFAVEVPAGWKAIANGSLNRVDTLPRGRTAWHWSVAVPIPVYTMVIGAGPMSVAQLMGTELPQSVWTFEEDSAFAVDGPFRRASDMVDVFSKWIGPFPYTKLAHVESSTRFGGMENASAIFYSENAYARRTLGEGTVAHEIAHQWFGDAVTEYDWHHLWLSEGFASYWDPLYNLLKGERDVFTQKMVQQKTRYMGSDVVGKPIIDTSETDLFALLNANNYQKGSWVLHMLRGEIGDTAFFRGMSDYYRTFRDSTALSSDFRRVMERHAGRDLGWFFRQWLLQPGFPKLRVSTSFEGDDLVVRAEQVQPAGWGTYRITVPVRIGLAHGGSRDLEIAMRGGREAVVRLTGAPGPLSSVEVDPDGRLLLEVVKLSDR